MDHRKRASEQADTWVNGAKASAANIAFSEILEQEFKELMDEAAEAAAYDERKKILGETRHVTIENPAGVEGLTIHIHTEPRLPDVNHDLDTLYNQILKDAKENQAADARGELREMAIGAISIMDEKGKSILGNSSRMLFNHWWDELRERLLKMLDIINTPPAPEQAPDVVAARSKRPKGKR